MDNKAIGLAVVLACTGFAQAQTGMTVDWTWTRADKCSSSSPAIKVTGIPAEARLLRVKLADHDAPAFNHGGGEVAHAGGEAAAIAAGALKDYTGPCPPNFGSFGHDYSFTVQAVGADGKSVLGSGTATKNFSAKSVPN